MDASFDQPAVGAAPKFRPLKVDLHTHILPEHMPDWSKQFGYGWPDFVRLEHHCSCKVTEAPSACSGRLTLSR